MFLTRYATPAIMMLSIFAVQTAASGDEIDPHGALRKMFEGREKLVSGRCEITGTSDARSRMGIGDSPEEERLKLIFDDRKPALLIEDGLDCATLVTPEFLYHATRNRSYVSRFVLNYNLAGRGGILPFRPQSLGFFPDPARRIERDAPTYDELKEWFKLAEILESDVEGDLLRLKVKLPRRHERDHDVTMQLWLDPNQDYTTSRIEEVYPDRAGYIFRSEMIWEKIDDVWLIVYFRQFRGHSPKMNWKLTWTDVNEKIDDSEFDVEILPNAGREAFVFAERSLKGGESGSLRKIQSREPKPEGDPNWSRVLSTENPSP